MVVLGRVGLWLTRARWGLLGSSVGIETSGSEDILTPGVAVSFGEEIDIRYRGDIVEIYRWCTNECWRSGGANVYADYCASGLRVHSLPGCTG